MGIIKNTKALLSSATKAIDDNSENFKKMTRILTIGIITITVVSAASLYVSIKVLEKLSV